MHERKRLFSSLDVTVIWNGCSHLCHEGKHLPQSKNGKEQRQKIPGSLEMSSNLLLNQSWKCHTSFLCEVINSFSFFFFLATFSSSLTNTLLIWKHQHFYICLNLLWSKEFPILWLGFVLYTSLFWNISSLRKAQGEHFGGIYTVQGRHSTWWT